MEVQSLDPHDLVGLGEGGVVVPVVEVPLPDGVVRDLLVELRGRGVRRGLGVEDRVEGLVLDLDQVGGVPSQLAGRRGDGDDRLADVANPPDGECVVLEIPSGRRCDLEEGLGLGCDLLADQRPVDALELHRLRDVDRADRRVRVGRPDEVDVRHAVALDVVDEDALTLDEPPILLPRDVLADEARRDLLLLDGDRLIRRDGRLAHLTSPLAAAAIASTMFT